jgi:hypothetical protein
LSHDKKLCHTYNPNGKASMSRILLYEAKFVFRVNGPIILAPMFQLLSLATGMRKVEWVKTVSLLTTELDIQVSILDSAASCFKRKHSMFYRALASVSILFRVTLFFCGKNCCTTKFEPKMVMDVNMPLCTYPHNCKRCTFSTALICLPAASVFICIRLYTL